MVPGLSLVRVVVVWSLPIFYSDSASSAHLHGLDEVSMHSYDHPLHWKVLKIFIYKYNMEV